MDDSELTRKAIAELMKEMDDRKENENLPTERKKNPLGKPNKLFLGRTINSMMKHNKRQTDRNLQRCERKLKELDAKKARHEFSKTHKNYSAKLKYSQQYISSENSNDGVSKSRKKRRKRKKRKCRSRSSTPSSTSCSNASDSSSNNSSDSSAKSRKEKKHKMIANDEEHDQDFNNEYISESTVRYYVDPNMAYAVMAYNQMNHLMQQQQLHQKVLVENELKESIEIPSDLSISGHSSPESSLNISLHSSSAEEDENGIVTFKLSSDDDENRLHTSQNVNESSTNKRNELIFSIDSDDKDSIHSHISLESKESQKCILKENEEIYISSSSDSDELEIVEVIAADSCK